MTINSGTRLGRYEIRSQLGAGGMGEVYLAEDTQLGRSVAIKLLPPETLSDEHARKRLVREARAAATLDHPNICSVYEVGEADGRSFIAMQYLEGETLDARIKRKLLELKESLTIATQVADALAEAHTHGIIHRDIQPGNIMITLRGQAKVMDFGLARVIAGSVETEAETQSMLTTPGAILGTVPYMSPEQVRGEALDGRSDIFSFGVVLYEMLSGRQPFASESAAATASAILTREPPRLARFMQEAPAELERIVLKALAKHRDERYQTVKDLLLDLKALKQELEFEAKLERSAPPKARVSLATASRGQSGATIDQAVASTVQVSQAHPTSSAEYLVAGIKQHKVAAIVVLIVVAAGIVGLAAYLRARNTEVAIESIAVIPFANQNHDPDSEYLSDGLTESIINSLTQLPNLKVIARSSVFHYKGKETDPMAVGKELGVRAVLTGRIIQRGDNLTISAELMDVRDNKQLWGEQYSEKVSDLLSVQREIASKITSNLRLKLSGEQQSRVTKNYTRDPEAYQLYLKGRYQLNKRTEDSLKRGVEFFNQSIEQDPNYALAYAGVADAYNQMGLWATLPPGESFPKAKAAAERALRLDGTLAEAHTALAFEKFNKMHDLDPNFTLGNGLLGAIYMAKGMKDEAVAAFLKGSTLEGQGFSPRSVEALNEANKKSGIRGFLQKHVELLQEESKQRYVSPYFIAIDYGYLGEKELAFEWLEKAYQERSSWLTELGVDPGWANLHSDPRFQDLLRRVGFPQ